MEEAVEYKMIKPEVVEGPITYAEMAAYNKLSADIKKLESQKEVLNKKFKKNVGLSVIKRYQDIIDLHIDEVEEYMTLLDSEVLDQDEDARLAELEEELKAFGLNQRVITVVEAGDWTNALKLGPNKLPVDDLLADFCPQDRSKIDDKKTIEFLKSKGLKSLIKIVEVPDQEAIESAIYDGKLSPKEFADNCITENIIVTLTIRKNKSEE